MRVPQERERRTAARMTGRYLITLQKDAHKEVSNKLAATGFKPCSGLPKIASAAAKPMPRGSQMMLPNIGVAVVDPGPDQEEALHKMAADDGAIMAVEPERIVQASEAEDLSDYMRGWQDAVNALSSKLIRGPDHKPAALGAIAAQPLSTWGLGATRVVNSRLTGAGIKVAVLDTGFDTAHPDFQGRQIEVKNFVGDNTPFHDGHGHGTHCIGTAAGPLHPSRGPRYGVACEAQIFAARVLDDAGFGGDTNILQAIDWAIEQRCEVISLSLGAPWLLGDPPFSLAYESAAQRALAAGCLLVVAAGNEAIDPQFEGAVASPGNCPSVLTVAAINEAMATAPFSNRVRPSAPGVKGPDIAGPGVDVYSSWLVADGLFNTISGTSMATPHVAGIAALYAQADPGARGVVLKNHILNQARALANAVARKGEIGRGLVQAP